MIRIYQAPSPFHRGFHETRIEIRLWWRRTRYYDAPYNNYCVGFPTLFIAYFHPPMVRFGFLLRVGLIHTHGQELPYPKEPEYGAQ